MMTGGHARTTVVPMTSPPASSAGARGPGPAAPAGAASSGAGGARAEGAAPVRPPETAGASAEPSGAFTRFRRFFARRPWIADTLVWALPLIFVSVLSSSQQGFLYTDSAMPVQVAVALSFLMAAPLALRRAAPLLSSLLIAGACLLTVLTMTGPSLSVFAVPLTIYSTTKWGTAAHGKIVLALGFVGSLLMGLSIYLALLQGTVGPDASPLEPSTYAVIAIYSGFCAAVVLSAWLLGGVAYRRRREIEGIRERNRLLEQERAAEARLAADAERMRIAREMHDVIAHSLSVVIVQADGGRYVAKTNPEAAAEVLATIAETGRSALAQTRSLLGVLRAESGEEREAKPLPGLAEVPALLADIRSAGLDVRLRGEEVLTRGSGLTEPVQLAVYRIVQESLTNVLKHAGASAQATVELAEGEGAFTVSVVNTGLQGLPSAEAGAGMWAGAGTREGTDDGAAGRRAGRRRRAADREALARTGGGNGIIGMRERAQLHGGELEAGPVWGTDGTANGFKVTARFPVGAPAALRPNGSGGAAEDARPATPTASEAPAAAAGAGHTAAARAAESPRGAPGTGAPADGTGQNGTPHGGPAGADVQDGSTPRDETRRAHA
jgi:signal transduction histidine kinase